MSTSIKSTDLDFSNIKTELKDYLKQKSEFTDYNFEGSALNNILDVLAYNTHVNGLIANFSTNESFLNTAQLRSSVISLSTALGYVPRSVTASKAIVNLSITILDVSRPATVFMPKNTLFNTTVDGKSYTFRTLEKLSASDDGNGFYEFVLSDGTDLIPIYEGVRKDKTFYVGEIADEQVYVIPDKTIDTSTVEVKVYPTATSAEDDAENYTPIKDAVRITADSTLYQIREVPNGTYELIFGDGITTGKRPVSGNKIEVSYLSCTGAPSNNATIFTPSSQLTVTDFGNYNVSVTTVTEAAGGDSKETIESVRQNAPIAFASQQRLVTAEDYTAQIKARYGNVLDDVISWGGADNDPPKYGTVYVGLKFKDNTANITKNETKDNIVNLLTNNLGIMSIDTEFTDPIETFIELNCQFRYDPDLSAITPRAQQNAVIQAMKDHFTKNLKKFGSVFRRSKLLAEIDDLDVAILNSSITVQAQQRFLPVTNKSLGYKVRFPMQISAPDDEFYRVTSGRFSIAGISCFIRNRLESNILEIVSTSGDIIKDNVGFYEEGSGLVQLEGFNPSTIDGGGELKVSVVPANQSTVSPLRNYTLNFDETRSNATAIIDYQELGVTL